MRKFVNILPLLFLGLASCNQKDVQIVSLSTQLDTVSYCIGQDLARYILETEAIMDIEPLDKDIIIKGIEMTLNGENILTFGEAEKSMKEYFTKTLPEIALKGSEEYLHKVSKSRKSIRRTESGLLYEIVKEGNGRHPSSGDVVYLMYEGCKRDGSVYESTYRDAAGEESFPIDKVISGWKEGLSFIGEGGVIKLWIHPDLAYGATGNERLGPNQALYYYIELISVM